MESSKIRILVIDDNHDNLITIKALIKDVFPEAFILTASDAKRGIELAAAEDPDVILLDIVMPGTDGFETCKKLKADENLCDIPVVFITALKDDKENRIRALEVGAEAFLAKPIEIIELTAQIRAMVKIKTAKQYRINEKDRLAALVAEQTLEIRQTQTVTLNLLEEVTRENEARKKSETALKQKEEYLRNIFENAPVGIFHSTLEGQFLAANQSVAKMIGYSDPEELILATADMKTQIYADPEIRPQLLDDLRDSDGWLRWENVLWRRKDGSLITISITGRKVHDAIGDFSYLEGFVEDITERHFAEAKFRETQILLEASIESPQDMIILSIDKDYNYLYFNTVHKKAMKISYGKEVKMGMNILDCITNDDDRRRSKINFDQALKGLSHITVEEFGETERNYYESRYNPTYDDMNEILGATMFSANITERKLSEKKIQAQLEELQRWHQVMLGREDRYRQLKSEVNELLNRLGETIRYPSQADDLPKYSPSKT